MIQEARQHRRLLTSWKEISAHFGVTVRTVQLWEAARGLPVHRMPGVKGRVYAYQDELDKWAAGTSPGDQDDRPAEVRKRPYASLWLVLAAGLVVIAAAAGLMLLLRPAPVPSSWALDGQTLLVKNLEGMPIWRHEFPEKPIPQWEHRSPGIPFQETRPWIGDLDGDGNREVLFTYAPESRLSRGSELYCFESDGTTRWQYKPGRLVSTRQEKFPPPYFIRMVLLIQAGAGKPPVLLVVGNHSIYYPSYVAALSRQGRVQREYWHSGHINGAISADLDADGNSELYLLANHNPTKTASLIALDLMDFSGASRESNPEYQLLGLGEPRELGRILFPASELTRRLFDVTNPMGMAPQSGRLFLTLAQRSPGADPVLPALLYQIGPRLSLLGIEYAWTFRGAYEEAVRTGKIKPYDLDADLERLKQIAVVTPWRGAAAASENRIQDAAKPSVPTEN